MMQCLISAEASNSESQLPQECPVILKMGTAFVYLALLGDVEVVDAAASHPCCGDPVAPVGVHIIVHQDRLKPISTLHVNDGSERWQRTGTKIYPKNSNVLLSQDCRPESLCEPV